MFIIVLFGDDQELIFNPECKVVTLLQNIKSRCKCDEDAVLDLSDEAGCVKHLSKNLASRGTLYVAHREKLVLLKVQKFSTGDEPMYIPLLKSKEKDSDYIAKLNHKHLTSRVSKTRRGSDALSLVINPKALSRRVSVTSSTPRRSSITAQGFKKSSKSSNK